MPDPLSVAGSIAGLISLAHVAVVAIKAVRDLISKLKHSSAEIRKRNHELGAVEKLLTDLEAYCYEHRDTPLLSAPLDTLEQAIEECQREFNELKIVFREPLEPPRSTLSRFEK
jgi:hypothetical protein